jgi:hypothetical protein
MAHFIRDQQPLNIEQSPLGTVTQLMIEFHDPNAKYIYQFILDYDELSERSTEEKARNLLRSVYQIISSNVQQAFISDDLKCRILGVNSLDIWQSALSKIEGEGVSIPATRSNVDLPPSVNELMVQALDFRRVFFLKNEQDPILMQTIWTTAAPLAQSISLGNHYRHILKVHVTPEHYDYLLSLAE